MAEYKVSEVTRERIISSARELFYEKGYKDTTYAEICRGAAVNEGTLHYQFKSKAAVGKAINRDTIQRNLAEAAALLGEAPGAEDMTAYALYNYIYWYKVFKDEKYRRFSYEIAWEYKMDEIDEYYDTFVPVPWLLREQAAGDSKEKQLGRVACISIDHAVPSFLAEHMEEYDYAGVSAYLLRTYARLLGYDEKKMEYSIKRAEEIMKSSDLGFLDTRLE